ncbi:MAG: hypothetical protein GWN32_20930 [Gemmatimonadetes bacterium]|nr:hypothetical protein [Gemmatimonadota bacterium]NIW38830.1 hypothetical protein [Gemmatimonadota bacterium]
MTCDTALERLLEADPAELAGQGDSELAAHVRDCARCGAVAAKLLDSQERLAAALNDMGPRLGVDEALEAARARRHGRPGRWRPAWRWAAPLAAAAAAAGIFFATQTDTSRMPGEPVTRPAPREEPLVEMASAQNLMVFETQDRSAKVIWFY